MERGGSMCQPRDSLRGGQVLEVCVHHGRHCWVLCPMSTPLPGDGESEASSDQTHEGAEEVDELQGPDVPPLHRA